MSEPKCYPGTKVPMVPVDDATARPKRPRSTSIRDAAAERIEQRRNAGKPPPDAS